MGKKTAMGKAVSASKPAEPSGYAGILGGLTTLISESRRRAAAAVNHELVLLYWQIGSVIVHQQEYAQWGDSVVERLAEDLRIAFQDVRGLTKDNLFRMRKFAISCAEIEHWLARSLSQAVSEKDVTNAQERVGTVCPQMPPAVTSAIVDTACPQLPSEELRNLAFGISWSHHRMIVARCDSPAERYFYMKMSAKERWSVRELRRQIDSVLYTRYTTVKEDPERCLPANPESGDLMPFRDHYVLEFLGLEEEHTEKELRHAILSNLRDFFLEFGRDLTFVGEEYPLTVGNDTFSIDLLFYHRRLQCLIAVDLKKGQFQPEYVGKSCFYCAALDERVRLEHENPTLGLVLCKSADSVQVRLALTEAANRIGVATYQTGLPDAELIERRLAHLRLERFPDDVESEEDAS